MATKQEKTADVTYLSNVERGKQYSDAHRKLEKLAVRKNKDVSPLTVEPYIHPNHGRNIRHYVGQADGVTMPCMSHPIPNSTAAGKLSRQKAIAGALAYDDLCLIVNGGSMESVDHGAVQIAAGNMGMRIQTLEMNGSKGFALFGGKTKESQAIESAFLIAILEGIDAGDEIISKARTTSNAALRIEMKEDLDAEAKARRAKSKSTRVSGSVDPKKDDAVQRTVDFLLKLNLPASQEIAVIEGFLKQAKKSTRAAFERTQTAKRPVTAKKTKPSNVPATA